MKYRLRDLLTLESINNNNHNKKAGRKVNYYGALCILKEGKKSYN
jgi:hypothetical protein